MVVARSDGGSFRLVWAALAALAGAGGQEPPASAPDPAGLVARLDAGEPGAGAGLQAMGSLAVPHLLAGFAQAAPSARLARATLLAGLAEVGDTPALAARLQAEPDPRVRLLLVHGLGRRDLAGWRDAIGPRVAALGGALADPEEPIRTAALERLVAMDEEEAAAALAGEVRRRSSPVRRSSLAGLARMESCWRVLPELMSVVEAELPDLLPRILPALGRRYRPQGAARLVAALGSADVDLRSAAYQGLGALDGWLFARRDHAARFALYREAFAAWPWNLDLAWSAAGVVVLDDRSLPGAAGLFGAMAALAPMPAEQEWAPETWARILLLQGVDRSLAGEAAAAQDLLRRSWQAVAAARARTPEAHLEDAALHLRCWLAWSKSLVPPLGEERRRLFARRVEAAGGPHRAYTVHLLQLGARIALVAAAAAHLEGQEEAAQEWLAPAVAALQELDQSWDADVLGAFGGHDEVLKGEAGPVALLQRGLGRAGRWREAEAGFLFLIRGLSGRLPELFLPPPPELGGGEAPAGREQERAFSHLTLDLLDLLDEAGEREKALLICQDLERRLRGRGLAGNQELRMRALFRLAGIYSDLRQPDEAETRLREYLRHYQSRKAEIEQHPEFFTDPGLALQWVDRVLAGVHVSLAVVANVLRSDTAASQIHCRRAFELDGRDFNRVLYACYLARAGEAVRARSLAEAVDEAPELLYNLACTWALMGEKDRAMALLERDFAVNHLTPRARNLHRDWARRDRDLAALAGHPGFQRLLEPERE